MGPPEETALKDGSPKGGWKSWTTKKKLIVLASVLVFIIVLAVGLGVGLGLGLGHGSGGEGEGEGSGGSNNNTTTTTTNGTSSAKWQPAVGSTWQIQLLYPINDTSVDVEIYDIDLFDNTKSVIDELHGLGRKVICYFSAGTYEDWRPDADKFRRADIGTGLEEWAGENWLNISSQGVREVMVERLDLAQSKGCDGVDPDNVDGYDNPNGLGLTQADSVDYMNWLAGEAHGRNMSIGLKNAGAIILPVIANMQWSVNEQCAQYNECDNYGAFPDNDKPVFHLEYPKQDENNNHLVTGAKKTKACDFTDSTRFSTLIKNMDLDEWYQTC
ncbi:hypothetical protein P175DRAFT_0512303 [Aspergillus ochraceoroseus IBT 24754]|uniref:alpha-galactosidase n=3 Tax=Aspergillus subgen. Nidulantes TaxID=2720870 RepID=A0A0F8WVK8_9EURO|nr:uncharacterized protein P175DRAFT_0512303 [Aspergillus ochraceoroseus IBT 24754]KKK15352.1 hypothetical protein ARAM_003552 [Aspergillus rambellii]KKK16241.1 hypothetical protein AOCH_007762 [Aspergillus ochraceoroseus]PTU17589.1 hypothetical protein P175DRAFT_0512303 [Aspergillus ochraceoroseus IBT 24754]